MKNRDYKHFAKDCHYHVYNRGNAKMDIFLDNEDYETFLALLRENILGKELVERAALYKGSIYLRKLLPPGSFNLLSYCLMPNHVHLQIHQVGEIPVSKLIGKVCTSYSMRFNKKYDRVGHVFQDRFKAVLIEDDGQMRWLSAYIHSNPKVANLVDDLGEWKYSSYPDYLNDTGDKLCNTDFILSQFSNKESYKLFIEDSIDQIESRKNLNIALLE
jgi:REP element-mobilizing transposase RayT